MNKSLKIFQDTNASIKIIEETEHINLKELWSDSSFMCRFPKETDFSPLEDIELPLELCAIFHKTEQKLEFIFAPLSDDENFLDRKTVFYYEGVEIKTEFSTPSLALELLATGYRNVDPLSDSPYRNLEIFADYYRTEEQKPPMIAYFKNKKPYSYFVSGNFKKLKNDFVSLCKHLNVYLEFFDRGAPQIKIINIDSKPKDENFKQPCYTNEKDFPDQISANLIDPIAIDLLGVAREARGIRLKYLFFYQILEYFSYYYLDEGLKRKLNNILKSPDLLHNPSSYTRTIIEELKDHTNNTSDKQKLSRLLVDYITIDDIIIELKCNIKNFCRDIEFDGGFKLSAILQDEQSLDKLVVEGKETKEEKKNKEKAKTALIESIADRVEKIRNVLVHIRESRENKVILPRKDNDRKLIPYLFLIRRIAETISIKYQG